MNIFLYNKPDIAQQQLFYVILLGIHNLYLAFLIYEVGKVKIQTLFKKQIDFIKKIIHEHIPFLRPYLKQQKPIRLSTFLQWMKVRKLLSNIRTENQRGVIRDKVFGVSTSSYIDSGNNLNSPHYIRSTEQIIANKVNHKSKFYIDVNSDGKNDSIKCSIEEDSKNSSSLQKRKSSSDKFEQSGISNSNQVSIFLQNNQLIFTPLYQGNKESVFESQYKIVCRNTPINNQQKKTQMDILLSPSNMSFRSESIIGRSLQRIADTFEQSEQNYINDLNDLTQIQSKLDQNQIPQQTQQPNKRLIIDYLQATAEDKKQNKEQDQQPNNQINQDDNCEEDIEEVSQIDVEQDIESEKQTKQMSNIIEKTSLRFIYFNDQSSSSENLSNKMISLLQNDIHDEINEPSSKISIEPPTSEKCILDKYHIKKQNSINIQNFDTLNNLNHVNSQNNTPSTDYQIHQQFDHNHSLISTPSNIKQIEEQNKQQQNNKFSQYNQGSDQILNDYQIDQDTNSNNMSSPYNKSSPKKSFQNKQGFFTTKSGISQMKQGNSPIKQGLQSVINEPFRYQNSDEITLNDKQGENIDEQYGSSPNTKTYKSNKYMSKKSTYKSNKFPNEYRDLKSIQDHKTIYSDYEASMKQSFGFGSFKTPTQDIFVFNKNEIKKSTTMIQKQEEIIQNTNIQSIELQNETNLDKKEYSQKISSEESVVEDESNSISQNNQNQNQNNLEENQQTRKNLMMQGTINNNNIGTISSSTKLNVMSNNSELALNNLIIDKVEENQIDYQQSDYFQSDKRTKSIFTQIQDHVSIQSRQNTYSEQKKQN